MKVGLMGGTFDPVHLGHLIAAEEARWRLDLDQVLFVPAGQPWLKVSRALSPAEDRRQMVRLAIAGHAGFKLSTVEMDRPGPTYTVETVARLQKELGPQAELFFILGCDSLQALPDWMAPEQFIAACKLVTVPRAHCQLPDVPSLDARLPGLSKSLISIPMPLIDISSTEVRRRVAAGQSIRYLVPEAVERYIRERRLYVGAVD